MDPKAQSGGQEPRFSNAKVFSTGAFLMFVWPVFFFILEPTDTLAYLPIYFVGTFFILFSGGFESLSDWLTPRFDAVWAEGFGWVLLTLMGMMWLAVLLLPFFGSWNRHPAILWITQGSYAAGQAICGWAYVQGIL